MVLFFAPIFNNNKKMQKVPRLSGSSRINWFPLRLVVKLLAAIFVMLDGAWIDNCDGTFAVLQVTVAAAAAAGYQAQPPDWPLNIRSLSYTDSFWCWIWCSFCDAKFLKTRLIDETYQRLKQKYTHTHKKRIYHFICQHNSGAYIKFISIWAWKSYN